MLDYRLLATAAFAAGWLCHCTNTIGQLPASDRAPQLQSVPAVHLHNVWQLSERVISGSEPAGEAAFAELQALGVQTVLSVDGIAPQVELARKHGLRYVHLPIGYDGIDAASKAALTRVASEVPGKIYVHCHHGKHRGPAAAAILCRADDGRSADAARLILQTAGTGKEYPGLWRDVDAYVRPPAGGPLPTLVERAKVDSLAAAMARIDRCFDRLKLLQSSNWQSVADQPDLVASQEALQLQELFAEALRTWTSGAPPRAVDGSQGARRDREQLREGLHTSARLAEHLRAAIEKQDCATARQVFDRLNESCTACHRAHRN